jgi:hypothetical protein
MKRKAASEVDNVDSAVKPKKPKGKNSNRDANNRSFNRYIQKVFKQCVPAPSVTPTLIPTLEIPGAEPKKKKKSAKNSLASDAVSVLNIFAFQLHERIMEEWKVYSVKNNKKLISEDDIAEIFVTLFAPHTPRPHSPGSWDLHSFSTKAVESYRKSSESDST